MRGRTGGMAAVALTPLLYSARPAAVVAVHSRNRVQVRRARRAVRSPLRAVRRRTRSSRGTRAKPAAATWLTP